MDRNMKKIVFFINNLSSGGAEHQLCELANGLAEKGYDITITTFGDEKDHYYLLPFIKRVKLAAGKSNLRKLLAIWYYFLSVKTNWVIAFGHRESRLCLMPILFRNRKDLKVIAGERNSLFYSNSKMESITIQYLYQRANYIVPNSHSEAEYIVKTYPQQRSKLVVITNFTDPDVFGVSKLPSGRVLRIGVFARYNEQKNCKRFVKAMIMLKSRTSQAFVVEWYGNKMLKGGENPYYLQLVKIIEEAGLQGVVLLNNHVQNVPALMPRFDAICLPSLYEGFSNSISEAICCGKPCLVSNVSDNGVMVKDGVNGFLFNPLDEEAIVSAFLKFFALPSEERQKLGLASREMALDLFNRDRFIGSYERLMNVN